MSEESEREEKPRKPSGPRGRGAAGGRPPTGAPRNSQPGKPRASDGEARPKRDYSKGDSGPKREYPQRDGGERPKRDYGKPGSTDRPKRDYGKSDSTDRPKRDYGKSGSTDRPQRAYPKRDGDARPKRDYGTAGGAARPPRDYDKRDSTDRPKRDYAKRDGDSRPPRSGSGAPRSGSGAPRSGAPRSGAPRTGSGAPYRSGASGGRPQSGDSRRRDDDRPPRPYDPDRIRPPRAGEGADRPRHDDPIVAEDVQAKDLDRGARAELKTLTKENADFVAEHLVMAGRVIEADPELAHRHALAAARRGGRIGVVREAVGITAYATGDFALALRELRTYRRITGRNDQLPLMVDSERGVGRPEAALELGRSVPRATLEVSVQVALAIAMSGARLDLGQKDAALTELQIPQLDPERAFSWSPSLFDAYATVLEELGHDEEAEQWWQRSDRASIALEQAAIPDGEDTVEIIEEQLPEVAVEEDPDAAASQG